jgi:tRNA-splicing ligase RtcB
MRLSVLDMPPSALARKRKDLEQAIERQCRFGVGACFEKRRDHAVMDDPAWRATPILSALKDRAWSQLGTSGSGNHFVEFGVLALSSSSVELGLGPGEYLALLSHSGSRGTGGELAQRYSKVAADLRPELPRRLIYLSWFDLESAEGREYWLSMELMGRYAAANHELIHRHVLEHLGAASLGTVENHHNFAWRERHDDREVVVHRKGATPAKVGDLGIVPGSMASPAYVVRGKGNPQSLFSAAHGAGRAMSRAEAKARYTWEDLKRVLVQRKVVLLSAGLDEVPMAYKDIEEVMAAQADLVEVVARFDPRLVKMAPAN